MIVNSPPDPKRAVLKSVLKLRRNYGKFKIFKVPGTWIPESDDEGDDEEGEMEADDSIYSEMVEEEGRRSYTVVTRP
jgi:hypothetical protein